MLYDRCIQSLKEVNENFIEKKKVTKKDVSSLEVLLSGTLNKVDRICSEGLLDIVEENNEKLKNYIKLSRIPNKR